MNEEITRWFLHPYVETLFGGTFHPGGLALSETLALRVEIRAGERVLDVGCGTGGTAVRIAHRIGCRVDGIDRHAALIPAAAARAEREGVAGQVVFVVGRAEALPFPDGAFHAALFESSYVFLDDPPQALAEAYRVLAPGGRVGLLEIAVAQGSGSAQRRRLAERVGAGARPATEAAYREAVHDAGFIRVQWTDEGPALVRFLKDLRGKLALAKMVLPALPPELRSVDLDAVRDDLDAGIQLVERGEISLGTLVGRKGKKASA
jgi:SAM-dependent methyltransferase